MRRIVARLIVGIAITTIGMFGADNSLGNWKRNIEKSKSTPPSTNPITSMTTVRVAFENGVTANSTGQRKDGTAINSSYSAKYDGKEYPVTDAPWDTISIKQVDANTLTTETKKTGGKYHTIGRTVISNDGKTMTVTNKGTDAEGKPVTNKIVYEKQ
jgi:hypothetical protein